jgi:hypothetical protein
LTTFDKLCDSLTCRALRLLLKESSYKLSLLIKLRSGTRRLSCPGCCFASCCPWWRWSSDNSKVRKDALRTECMWWHTKGDNLVVGAGLAKLRRSIAAVAVKDKQAIGSFRT